MSRHFLAALVLLAPLTSCGDMQDAKPLSEAAILDFHTHYNAAEYKAVFDAADGRMRAAQPEAEFTDMLQAVHAKLGSFRSTQSLSCEISSKNLKTLARIRTDTTFADGHGTETFTYSVSGGVARLLSYNISSKELLK